MLQGRVFTGRLKYDYEYSNTLLYNIFQWADIDRKKEKIERIVQTILLARSFYPDPSLAVL